MLGWEFPPFISGGLGTACHGLTRALSARGTEILFVLPRPVTASGGAHVRLLGAPSGAASDRPSAELPEFANVRFRSVPAGLSPYERPEVPRRDPRELPADTPPAQPARRSPAKRRSRPDASGAGYGRDLFAEVDRYAALVCRLARYEDVSGVRRAGALAWVLRGEQAAAKGRDEAARQAYERALGVDPGNALARARLGALPGDAAITTVIPRD